VIVVVHVVPGTPVTDTVVLICPTKIVAVDADS
jgi:hypothetical protein